jgi:hypothetical protein
MHSSSTMIDEVIDIFKPVRHLLQQIGDEVFRRVIATRQNRSAA